MAEEPVFTKGIRGFKPRDGAPDFVIGSAVINVEEFTQWVHSDEAKKHYTKYGEADQLRLKILKSKKDGSPNFLIDTFVPDSSKGTSSGTVVAPKPEEKKMDAPEPSDDLPFILTLPIMPLIGLISLALMC